MKGKNRGILILSILLLVVLAIFLRNTLISQPRVENDTPDISIVKGQDSEISTRDNNEIEDKESIPSQNIDIKKLIEKIQDSRIHDQQIVNEQDNLNDNQEASSPISNKQGDKEADKEAVNVPDEEKEQNEDEDLPDPNECNGKIQEQQEDTDDSYGPIVSGK